MSIITAILVFIATFIPNTGSGWADGYLWPPIPGDDNGNGMISEDESGFDCRIHGNKICGDELWRK